MADTLLLQLVSPERMLVDEQVSEVQVPGLNGYMGILPGHAPLLSELMSGGVLSYKGQSGEKVLAVYGGFVEVQPDHVRVLADFAERKEEINVEQAREELRKANEEAGKELRGEAEPAVVLDRIAKAQAKIDAAGR